MAEVVGFKASNIIYTKQLYKLICGIIWLRDLIGNCVFSSISVEITLQVRISLFNFQLYRHIDHPGWKMSWTWRGDEVIWNMWGAETTDQGNCSRFRGKQLPYCCEKTPVIVDLMPGAPYNLQTANCCKGGVLSSMTQDMSKYGATFQMNVAASTKSSDFVMPQNFTLGLAGYSCGKPFEVSPSKFYTDGGRRRTQALSKTHFVKPFLPSQVKFLHLCKLKHQFISGVFIYLFM